MGDGAGATLYKEALDLVAEDDVETRRDIRRRLALAYQMHFHLDPIQRAPGA